MASPQKFRIASLLTKLLTTAWYAVVLLIVGTACLLVAAVSLMPAFVQLSLPVAFQAQPLALHVSAVGAVSGRARLDAIAGHANLAFAPPGRLFVAATFVGLIVGLGLGLWLIQQLRSVFDSARRGQPFIAANAIRIRHMAYVIFAAEGARAFGEFAWNRYALTHFALDGWRFDSLPNLHLSSILAGLVVLALSEVFRAGTQLDEDQSLTV